LLRCAGAPAGTGDGDADYQDLVDHAVVRRMQHHRLAQQRGPAQHLAGVHAIAFGHQPAVENGILAPLDRLATQRIENHVAHRANLRAARSGS
jgi:hypothetical protein